MHACSAATKTCRRCLCCRLEREKGAEAAAAALLGAVVFALDAQQEAGAPAALRSMLAPAASVAAAVIGHAQQQKPARRLELSGAIPAAAAASNGAHPLQLLVLHPVVLLRC